MRMRGLLLTKLPKTQRGVHREKLDHVPRLLDSTPASIIRQVCPQLQSGHCQKLAGAALTVRCHGLFSKEACLSTRCRWFRPLAEAIPSRFPRSRQDSAGRSCPQRSENCQNCLQCLRPVGVMEMSSSVGASRRLPDFSLLCANPAVASVGTSAAHAPNGSVPVLVCLPHQRGRSRVNASFTWGFPLGPKIGMFRSIASSLISSARSLFQPVREMWTS